jgi:hypothetical protein
MSDFKGAALMIDAFPKAKALLGDKGYDADWLRRALIDHCIPSKSNSKIQIDYDKTLYASATESRTCSAGLRTGGASTPATTDAHTPSCPPSPRPSSFGSDQ